MFHCIQKQTINFFYGVVILVLLCSSIFAQENNDSKATGEAIPPVCPYEVNENDSVYFQISGYDIKTPSWTIDPYVYLRKEVAEKVVENQSTRYVNGGLSGNMPDTSSYELYFEEGDAISYQIEVWKTFGRNRCYTSGKITAKKFFAKWRQNTDTAKPFNLEIANGDVLTFKYNREKSGRFYFRIKKYSLTDRDYNKDEKLSKYFMVDCNRTRLLTSSNVDDKLTATILNPKDFEFMVTNNQESAYTFTVVKNAGYNENLLCSEFPAKIFIDKLKAKMAAFPEDSTQWNIEVTSEQGNTIFLNFAGIRRIYSLSSVTIPKISDARNLVQYMNGAQPCIRVDILNNGYTIKWYDCPKNGWDVQFSSNCTVEIREAVNEKYSIQLRDKKTWFTVINLTDINEIKDVDFRKPIKETLAPLDNQLKAIIVKFAPYK